LQIQRDEAPSESNVTTERARELCLTPPVDDANAI